MRAVDNMNKSHESYNTRSQSESSHVSHMLAPQRSTNGGASSSLQSVQPSCTLEFQSSMTAGFKCLFGYQPSKGTKGKGSAIGKRVALLDSRNARQHGEKIASVSGAVCSNSPVRIVYIGREWVECMPILSLASSVCRLAPITYSRTRRHFWWEEGAWHCLLLLYYRTRIEKEAGSEGGRGSDSQQRRLQPRERAMAAVRGAVRVTIDNIARNSVL